MTHQGLSTENQIVATGERGSCSGRRPLQRVAAAAAAFSLMMGVGVFAASAASAAEATSAAPSASVAAEQAVLTIAVTGPATLKVTNPTDKTVQVVVHLEGQHGHGGTTYDAGTRELPAVAAHADGEVIRFADFSHDWGHNLYGVKYDFLVDGQLVAEVRTPGGVAPTGTTVAQPVPGVVIPPVESSVTPETSAAPEQQKPTPHPVPKLAPQKTVKAPEATPQATPMLVPSKSTDSSEATTATPYPVPKLAPTKKLVAPYAVPQATPDLVPGKTPQAHGDKTPGLVPSIPSGQLVPEQQSMSVPTPSGDKTPSLAPRSEATTASHVATTTPRTVASNNVTDGTGEAGSTPVQTSAGAPPAGHLASTGAESAGLLAGAAAALLGAGAALTLGSRRRRAGSVR
ncbi:hypothetical protein [Demequina zhanjiangensis]|uniref:LPXTG-motif cell wall anchor domain-containing protein n=1 Tax=Demequina zhanjiangensis TaxID=3051659 RepID=A0ABT8G0R5_9MICO|nr:hypothetical protein [Demequina sp. SYSU T00b26]MDN4472712.1 hypothetical protein [Demequina sp. SYSU T00b26]